jgi:hypothetical protein
VETTKLHRARTEPGEAQEPVGAALAPVGLSVVQFRAERRPVAAAWAALRRLEVPRRVERQRLVERNPPRAERQPAA